ncbi:unnamed protein product [Plutella xylostella]|uniref:(diamondback moth) hypothetical protein n=1 Tax=Plutella xylostella TaxID=51655 RepID=A0A8S4GC42_PLUXY|nr:unnamed protein product [Plutella xylostella]
MLTQYVCTVATLILISQNVFGSFVIPRIPFNPNQRCYLSKACHHSGGRYAPSTFWTGKTTILRLLRYAGIQLCIQ